MITYLPSRNFEVCAKVLHPDHLKRCIQEAVWIGKFFTKGKVKSIYGNTKKWRPVYSLWITEDDQPLLSVLREYQLALGRAWFQIHGSCHQSIADGKFLKGGPETIKWSQLVHMSHRHRLLNHSKYREWYRTSFVINELPLDLGSNRSLFYIRPREVSLDKL